MLGPSVGGESDGMGKFGTINVKILGFFRFKPLMVIGILAPDVQTFSNRL